MTKSRKTFKQKEILLDENFEFPEGRKPPNAVDLEKQILGAILIDNQIFMDIVQILDRKYFYNPENAIIFQAMVNLDTKSEPIDISTVKAELERLDKLETAGGIEYLVDLSTSVSTSANAQYYARIVYEKYILRDLIHIASGIAEKCFEPTVDPFAVLGDASKNILEISDSLSKKKVISFKDEVENLFEELGARRGKREGSVTGIPTGYNILDDLTSGFQNSELIIIAGRPSHGKTAFALNIARNAALLYGKSVAVFSIEMTMKEIGTRIIASEARVDQKNLKTGRTSNDEWARVAQALSKLKINLFIDDTSELTALELRAKARRLKTEHNIDMVMVDYLQLIKGDMYFERRDLEVAYVSRSLKALAKELQIPVVACAQLNRGIEQRGKEKRPQLADLRESGAIEQDADVVIFIHRPILTMKMDKTDPEFEETYRKAEIVIGKQRNGPTGDFNLVFLPEYTRFENVLVRPPVIEIPPDVGGDNVPF